MTLKWAAFVVGLILIVSPWVLGFSAISLAKWCNVLVGLMLAIVSAWMLFGQVPGAAIPATADPPRSDRSPRRKNKASNQ